ncbi:MAG: hypothetical protein HEP71_17355 [Roseivirga sp.]|nr:hypothetical protein [Roseivirga sp.]
MSPKKENIIFLLLLFPATFAAILLFFGDSEALGDEVTTEYILKVLLYPAVLGLLVLLWRKIDRRIKNDKPMYDAEGEEDKT